MNAMNALPLREESRLDLRSIGNAAMASRWRTEAMRAHATPRLIFIHKGQGRITVAGLTSGYGPNNLIFVPAGTMYGIELGPMAYGQLVTIPRAMADDWPDDPVHLRLRDVAAQKELVTIMDGLEAELRSDRPGAVRAAHYQAGLLSVFFERQRGGADPEARRETSQARLAAAYTDLVERDFRSGRGVADLARDLGVTPTHLTRVCKHSCGKSALTILNQRIHLEACRLLRETRKPIKDIAAGLGFNSAAYFTRAFQASAGMTPSDFRRGGG
jgi:AraC-like DNA-binding protein